MVRGVAGLACSVSEDFLLLLITKVSELEEPKWDKGDCGDAGQHYVQREVLLGCD